MNWWRDAVFYEIYVRSFQDSNDDGVGDLNGVTSRLDYLSDLGVDALWLTPFYPSPQIDFGYDVSDHEAVDPQFGTLDDFDRLVAEAHARGLKMIVDIVLNHTSDRHPWFESARSSRSSPHRDWYIWRDGRNDGAEPPNNWESAFGGPAWTRDEASGQWYYHCFYPEQPDLNWRNVAVRTRMFDTVRFWLEHGVDGFRLDAINTLFEDPALRDNPLLPQPRIRIMGVQTQRQIYNRGLPELDPLLRDLRRFVDAHGSDVVLITEAYLDTPEELLRFYDDCNVQLPFNFFLAEVPALDAGEFRRAIERVEGACGDRWPSLVLSNHDIDRACDRFVPRSVGEGGNRSDDSEPVARLLATLICTLRGSPFLYYGEEIAMRTVPPTTLDEVRDPVGRRFWPDYKGRDGSRRPMQWNASAGAGFTRGEPWLGVTPDWSERNVERQHGAAGSVLEYYRALLRIRRSRSALRSGVMRMIGSDPGVLAFTRTVADDEYLVLLNFTDAVRPAGHVTPRPPYRVVLGTHSATGTVVTQAAMLEPFECAILAAEASTGAAQ